jgi:ABC-2 type transport system permease protein
VSTAAMTLKQVRYENKAFWRNPASAFFTFVFPLMFLVIFNSLFKGTINIEISPEVFRKVNSNYFYVPAIGAFSVITATYVNLAISISFSRDMGTLKRIRGTPLPAGAYMLSRIVHAMFVCIILITIVVLAGIFFYDVDLPTEFLGGFILTVLVGGASFCALGLALTAIIPNADASPAIVNATVLPLQFISGIFIPLDNAPDWIVNISKFFPIYHLAQAMQGPFNPFDPEFKGNDLLIVAIWGVVGLALAVRFFTWEPRK